MAVQQYVYFQGGFVPAEDAKVSVLNHAFNYGTGCFEGIRGYATAEASDVLLFRLREHMTRLHQSSHIIGCDVKLTVDELCDLALEVVRRNEQHGDVYIRPLVYKCGTGIGVTMAGVPDDVTIFSVPFGKYIETEKGIRCSISSWRRSSDNNIPPRAKITGGYINAALAKHEALANGFDEAIMLTDDGSVSEGSAENLFIVRNGVLYSPAVSDSVLEGITRATVSTLAEAELGIRTVERKISRTELYTADEVFLCGTGAEISPVIEVDRRKIGAGVVGPITSRLQTVYFSAVRGEQPAYASWVTSVYKSAAVPPSVVASPARVG
ncbi:MAG: branched-chain amino acid aminotransferase [Chloroflexi bacterium]|nr:branched-chain amino acid aminotransferase [Chloroflexota bacterium]